MRLSALLIFNSSVDAGNMSVGDNSTVNVNDKPLNVEGCVNFDVR